MKQLFLGNSGTSPSTTANTYWSLMGASTGRTAFSDSAIVVPCDGTFSNFRVVAQTNQSGGNSFAYGLYVDDAASSLWVTGVQDTILHTDSDSVGVTAGQRVAIVSDPTSSPSASNFKWMIEFTPTTEQRFMVGGGCGAADLATSGTTYIPICGDENSGSTTESIEYAVMPVTGTLKTLYVWLNQTVLATTTIAVSVNGSVTGAPTVSISDPNTSGNNSTDLAVTAGDRVSVRITGSGTYLSAGTRINVGVLIAPTTNGQFPLMYGASDGNNLDTGVASYGSLCGVARTPATTTRTVLSYGSPDFTIVGCYIYLLGNPGTGKSYTFTLQEDGAEASVPFSIAFNDSETNGKSIAPGTYTFTPANESWLGWKCVPSGTPTARRPYVSYVGYIASGTGLNVSPSDNIDWD